MIGESPAELREFIREDEFAVKVDVRYENGRVDTFSAIFDDPALVAVLGHGVERDISTPTLTCVGVDVEGLNRGDRLIVRGIAYDAIGRPLGDGTGMVVVRLAKA